MIKDKRKFFSVLLFMVFLIGFFFAREYSIAKDEDIILTLNSKNIKNNSKVILENGVLLAPTNEIFKELGVIKKSYTNRQNEKIYTFFRKNMFAKIKLNSNNALLNGNDFKLTNKAIEKDGDLYICISFLSKFLNGKYSAQKNTVNLLARNTERMTYISNILFEEQYIPEFNFNISLPYGWTKLGDRSYGIKNKYDDLSFSFEKKKKDGKSPDAIINEILEMDRFKNSSLSELEKSKLEFEDYHFDCISFKETSNSNLGQNNKNYHHMFYIQDSIDYYNIFQLKVKNKFKFQKEKKAFAYSLRTVQHSFFSFSSEFEHYIEYDSFFENKLKLNTDISSNMEVYDKIKFEMKDQRGSLKNLLVDVYSEGKKFTREIKKQNSSDFSFWLYAPFGIGRHKVIIKDLETREKIMQFSMINLSPNFIRYTLPTDIINSESAKIKSISNSIFKDHISDSTHLSDEKKARLIYDYIKKNIKIKKDKEISDISRFKKIEKLDLNAELNSLELNALFTALLRYNGLNTRMIKGENFENDFFYTKSFINGKWSVFDIYSSLIVKNLNENYKQDENSLDPSKRYKKHFNLSEEKYNSIMEKELDLEM